MEEISPTFIWTHFFFYDPLLSGRGVYLMIFAEVYSFVPHNTNKKMQVHKVFRISWKEVYSIAKHWTKHPWEMQLHRVLRIIMHSHDSLKLILLLNIVQNTYKKWNCIRCSEFPCNLTMISSLFVCCTLYKIPRIQHNDCQYQQDLFIV